MTQISIFGEEKQDAKIKVKSAEKVKKAKPIRPNDKLPEGRPLLVCYARYSFEVSIEERAELRREAEIRNDGSTELDILREKMEREFPELSKERVQWHWTTDEDESESTNEPIVVVPVVTAGVKGAIVEKIRGIHTSVISMLRDPRPVHTLYARDGVYEVRKLPPIGIFSVCLKKQENPCGDFWEEGLIFALPRIPRGILDTVISKFRASLPNEDIAFICWHEKAGYYVVFPQQEESSRTHVVFSRPTNLTIVVEVHSHGHLPAFFSSTDNEDEKATGIYAVLGRLETPSPEIALSYVCGGIRKPIDHTVIFQ